MNAHFAAMTCFLLTFIAFNSYADSVPCVFGDYIGSLEPYTQMRQIERQGDYAYATDRDDLYVFDVSDPTTPIEISGTFFSESISDLIVQGTTAYLASRSGVEIYDVSDPNAPFRIGMLAIPDLLFSNNMVINGDNLYFTDILLGLMIIDIQDPAKPQLLSSVGSFEKTNLTTSGLTLHEDIVYLSTESTLTMYDVTDSMMPQKVGVGYSDPNLIGISFVQAIGDRLYISATFDNSGSTERAMLFFNIDSPGVLSLQATMPLTQGVQEISRIGDILYIAVGGAGIVKCDLSDPLNPVIVSEIDTPGSASDFQVTGSIACVADTSRGLQILDLSSNRTSSPLVAFLDNSTRDISIDGTIAAITSGGVKLVDIVDPENPAVLSSVPVQGDVFSVLHENTTAYITTRDFVNTQTTFQIIDTSDPTNPALMGSYVRNTNRTMGDAVIVENRAYIAASGDGIIVLDISNPSSPQVVGQNSSVTASRGMTHHQGFLYVGSGTSLDVYSLSSPNSPSRIASIQENQGAETIWDTMVENDMLYVAIGHSGAGNYIPRLDAYDISTPSNPILLWSYLTGEDANGLDIIGTTLCIAAENRGLLLLDISDPLNPVQSGWFNPDQLGNVKAVSISGFNAYLGSFTGDLGFSVVNIDDQCEPCLPDLNKDRILDFFDVSAFLTAFGQQDPITDFTGDGGFDFFDVSAFLQAFSTGCP